MWVNELVDWVSLDGPWGFGLGGPAGVVESPGCWEAQTFSKYPDGPALYRRRVVFPAAWAGQVIQLHFEAVSYACTVRLNGVEVGRHQGMWTPFTLDVTAAARQGVENQLELEIYKPGERYPMRGCIAGFLPDLAAAFGGIWQASRVEALTCALVDPWIEARYAERCVRVQARAELFGAPAAGCTWRVTVMDGERQVVQHTEPLEDDGEWEVSLPIPDARLWQPDRPSLYTVCLELLMDDQPRAALTRRVGFRRLTAQGDQLLLNDQPVMARGILAWGWDPDRIAPAWTLEEARAELRKVRAMGFNLVKLCLFIPNPAYFEAADEEGVLLWQELPMWLPQVTDDLRQRAPLEYAEMARLTAYHPAVVLYSLGCEMNSSVDGDLLARLDEAVRGYVPDGLMCDNSGSGESYGGLDFDFADFTDYHPYYDLHYFEPLLDHWRRDWQSPRPWILGEFCDADTFRDQTELIEANGGERPWWLTKANPVTTWRAEAQAAVEWAGRLEAAQIGFSLPEITRASYRQALVVRKYTLEALRRRRVIGGYVITGLRDTPISTSGVWDDLGRAKWPAAEFSRINGEAVLALDVVRRRTWRHGGDRPDRVDPSNYWAGDTARWHVILSDTGSGFPAGARWHWSLTDLAGQPVSQGEGQLAQNVSPGLPVRLGTIVCRMPEPDRAAEFSLQVSLEGENRPVVNRWPVWVYPRPGQPPQWLGVHDPEGRLSDFGGWLSAAPPYRGDERVVITTTLDERLWVYLYRGGRAVLLQQGMGPLPARRLPFWREAVHLFAPHPLWARFPHQGYADLQFFGLAGDLAFDSPRLAEALPHGFALRPVMRRLDARAFTAAEYLFEAYGRGRLLGCTLRLEGGQGAQPFGLNRSPAGGALLAAMVELLNQDEP